MRVLVASTPLIAALIVANINLGAPPRMGIGVEPVSYCSTKETDRPETTKLIAPTSVLIDCNIAVDISVLKITNTEKGVAPAQNAAYTNSRVSMQARYATFQPSDEVVILRIIPKG